ncbi:MAG TPA: DNA-3-methyladenine glycosylase [Gemmatimonadota bacterium]|nr:DNA-3-methyladenine glycosylase [Gemmatimonadota bacterium]
MRPLPRSFYDRDTLVVARELLGCVLVHEESGQRVSGRIVEVEAYHGEEDPACHAAAGLTARTAPLYGRPGFGYVYRIYGMYYCFNVVTRAEGHPSAVLVRALEPIEGLDTMRERRAARRRIPDAELADRDLASGPGKLCDALAITLDQNRADLQRSPLRLEPGEAPDAVVWTPRVGISVGTDRFWRCFVKGSPHVSRSHLNRVLADTPRPATV